MALDFSTEFKNAACNYIATNMLEAGAIQIRTGSSPGANSAATGTLLVTFTIGANMGEPVVGVSSLSTTITGVAVADGTAGYARFLYGTQVFDGTVGLAAADFILSSLTIVNGYNVDLTAFTWTFS